MRHVALRRAKLTGALSARMAQTPKARWHLGEYRKYKAPFPMASPPPTVPRAAGRLPNPAPAAGRQRPWSCLGLGDRQEPPPSAAAGRRRTWGGVPHGALGAALDSSAMTRAARHVFWWPPQSWTHPLTFYMTAPKVSSRLMKLSTYYRGSTHRATLQYGARAPDHAGSGVLETISSSPLL
jgi:hypothetical protein